MKLDHYHYFFKFGKGNSIFKEIYLKNKELKEGAEIHPSIYYGEWKVKDYRKKSSKFVGAVKDSTKKIEQIEEFFECGKKKNLDKTRFWIFCDGKVYVLKPYTRIKNGPDNLKDRKGSFPKTIPSEIEKIFSGDDLPEFFATIDSNQKYNRKTIALFRDEEKEICNHLLKNGIKNTIEIKRIECLNYLSPVQFETLIFLIFHHNNVFCSTYRGGTQKGIDLRIKIEGENILKKDFKADESGQCLIQVKKKNNGKVKEQKFSGNKYLIHLGESDKNQNILGRDWVDSQLKKLVIKKPVIKEWLQFALKGFKLKK